MATSPSEYLAQRQGQSGLAATPDDFLFLEALLVQRLQEQLEDKTAKLHILTAPDLAAVQETNQPVPAVHVLYQGYSASGDYSRQPKGSSAGAVAAVVQSWVCTVAVRNVRTIKTGSSARTDAGPLVARVAQALMGWQPAGCSKPLKLVNAAQAAYSAGYMYLPLQFDAEFVLRS
jgi:hypothetical protein